MEEFDGDGEDYDRLMSLQDRSREERSLENVGFREGMAAGEGWQAAPGRPNGVHQVTRLFRAGQGGV